MKKVKKATKKSAPKKKKTTKVKKVVKTKSAMKKKTWAKPKKKLKELPVVEVSTLPEEVIEDPIEIPTPPTTKTSKRPVKYLNNRDLLAQVLLSKKQGKMTNELAKMLTLLAARYGKKGNFANYTYNDDMQSYAMLMLVKTWQGFDPAKSSNPFAWFTQCIKNSFIQYLNQEARQRDIRDEALVSKGLSPSFSYQYDYEERQANADSADIEVVDAPTKLHEDVDNFSSLSDTGEEDSVIPESY